MVVVNVIYLMGIGCGKRIIRCINPMIALLLMKVSGALSMEGLTTSIPSGVGNPKIVTCPDVVFLRYLFLSPFSFSSF